MKSDLQACQISLKSYEFRINPVKDTGFLLQKIFLGGDRKHNWPFLKEQGILFLFF